MLLDFRGGLKRLANSLKPSKDIYTASLTSKFYLISTFQDFWL